jgi:putative flippase GtrA
MARPPALCSPRPFGERVRAALKGTLADLRYLVRYISLGPANVAVNFSVFWVLYHVFDVWYMIAAALGFAARFLFKFFALHLWVFGHAKGAVLPRFMRFALIDLTLYLIGTPLLYFLVEWGGLPPPLSLILAISILYLVGLVGLSASFKQDNV